MQGGKGTTVWTLTGDAPGTVSPALSQAKHWQMFEGHHGHKLKGLPTTCCNLMELLLFDFTFKREEISRNACVLSPFFSLPLNL